MAKSKSFVYFIVAAVLIAAAVGVAVMKKKRDAAAGAHTRPATTLEHTETEKNATETGKPAPTGFGVPDQNAGQVESQKPSGGFGAPAATE